MALEFDHHGLIKIQLSYRASKRQSSFFNPSESPTKYVHTNNMKQSRYGPVMTTFAGYRWRLRRELHSIQRQPHQRLFQGAASDGSGGHVWRRRARCQGRSASWPVRKTEVVRHGNHRWRRASIVQASTQYVCSRYRILDVQTSCIC